MHLIPIYLNVCLYVHTPLIKEYRHQKNISLHIRFIFKMREINMRYGRDKKRREFVGDNILC